MLSFRCLIPIELDECLHILIIVKKKNIKDHDIRLP
jgi:hypothetical protein